MQVGFFLEGYGDHHVGIGKVFDFMYDTEMFYLMHTHTGIIRNSSDVATRKNLMIDKHTKVICQGFTGKQVATHHTICIARLITCGCRAQCIVNRPLLMALTWLEVCPQEKEAPLTWACLCSIALQRYSISVLERKCDSQTYIHAG